MNREHTTRNLAPSSAPGPSTRFLQSQSAGNVVFNQRQTAHYNSTSAQNNLTVEELNDRRHLQTSIGNSQRRFLNPYDIPPQRAHRVQGPEMHFNYTPVVQTNYVPAAQINYAPIAQINYVPSAQIHYTAAGQTKFVPAPPESFLVNRGQNSTSSNPSQLPIYSNGQGQLPIFSNCQGQLPIFSNGQGQLPIFSNGQGQIGETVQTVQAVQPLYQSIKRTYVPHHIYNEIPVFSSESKHYVQEEPHEDQPLDQADQHLIQQYEKLYGSYMEERKKGENLARRLEEQKAAKEAGHAEIREVLQTKEVLVDKPKKVDCRALAALLIRNNQEVIDQTIMRQKNACINKLRVLFSEEQSALKTMVVSSTEEFRQSKVRSK